MSNLIFIEARGGLTTGERLLQVINQYPDGCTIKHLSNSINWGFIRGIKEMSMIAYLKHTT